MWSGSSIRPRTAITVAGLEKVLRYIGEAGHVRELKLRAVTEDRRPVFPGGLAILMEVLSVLEIKELRIADGAMREGLLYDMVGRLTRRGCPRAHRARDAAALSRRFRAGRTRRGHGARIPRRRPARRGSSPIRWRTWALKWASRLHEMGLDVSHNGYHRHGAYLTENADMPGFSREEQRLLARLIGGHRRKLTWRGSRSWCRRGIAARSI